MGICGAGMGALAGMFHERGFRVTGSDQGAYPPMSDFLAGLGIEVMKGYNPSHLDSRPSLVVVGNVIRRTNPEAVHLEESGIPYTTMPGALNRYFMQDARRIVITGTHGKTTVTAMVGWILHQAGLDPGFFIGGLPRNFPCSYRLGNGSLFVVEGDEYDTAYFDKKPKFLHYCPHIGVVTSCEFDHGDIYGGLEEISMQFRKLIDLIPPDGRIIACGEDSEIRKMMFQPRKPIELYGRDESCKWSIKRVEQSAYGMETVIMRSGKEVARGALPVVGDHNVLNSLAAVAASAAVGVDPRQAMKALSSFMGVARRQEIVGESTGITIIADFAHHPTAVRVTCEGVKAHYPNRRLIAVFEPRTNTSRRAIFQSAYPTSFAAADLVILREPRNVETLPATDRFSAKRLAEDLAMQGRVAVAFEETKGILAFLEKELHHGDVVLIMSTGNFDNLSGRLLATIGEQAQ